MYIRKVSVHAEVKVQKYAVYYTFQLKNTITKLSWSVI